MEQKDFSQVTSHLQDFATQRSTSLRPAHDHLPPHDHLHTLQAQIDAIARGDLATLLQHATDDVSLSIFAPPELPFISIAHGAADFRRVVEHNFGAVTNQRPAVRDVFTEGDTVVLFGRETGVVRSTGVSYDVEFVERFTFRDDRLASVQIIAAHAKPVGD